MKHWVSRLRSTSCTLCHNATSWAGIHATLKKGGPSYNLIKLPQGTLQREDGGVEIAPSCDFSYPLSEPKLRKGEWLTLQAEIMSG